MAGRGLIELCARSAFAALGLVLCIATGAGAQDVSIRFTLNRQIDGLAAPFLTALDKGYYKEAGLAVTIEPGDGSRESVSRVASGQHQLGLADINTLIRYRDGNADADIKAIMMAHDIAPYAIIGRKSLGISGPSDLTGKTLGATPPDVAFALWPSFAAANAIDPDKVTIESLGYALRESVLAQGQVDAILGSSLTSYIGLKSKGVAEEDITIILMAENGLDLYGDAVMVNPEFAKLHPDAVKGFVKATIRGFVDVIADPAGNIDPVHWRNYDMLKSVEAERLRLAVNDNIATGWVKANGLGGVDMERLARSIAQLGSAYGLKAGVTAQDVFTEAYLPPASERMVP
jgi:NitT/TauT family transport system substrate-binding protein